MGGPGDATYEEGERRALRGMEAIDITHRDRAADRGTEAATGHSPDGLPRGTDDRRVLARRCPPIGLDADAPARRSLGQLAQYDRGAEKPAFGSAPPADRPREPGLDRGRRLV